MLARRLSDRAMKDLDTPESLTDPESSVGDVSHSLPNSAEELRTGASSRSVTTDASDGCAFSHSLPDSAEELRNGSSSCSVTTDTTVGEFSHSLPNSAEDLKNGSSSRSVTNEAAPKDDGDCLPFTSEDAIINDKLSQKDPMSSSSSSCSSRRCGICGVVLLVLTALAVGLGVGLSNRGQKVAHEVEDWASGYLPDFMGGKGATEDTAGMRSDPSFEDRGTIRLTSPEFEYGEPIPVRYTVDAGDVSPPLDWSELPKGTKSVAIICEDVDFPHPSRPAAEPFVHWLAYDIHSVMSNLPENLPKEKGMDSPLMGKDPATGEDYTIDLLQGITSYGVDLDGDPSDPDARLFGWGYHGPDPPVGHPPHRYYFRLLALDGTIKDHIGKNTPVVTVKAIKELIEGDDPELNVLGFGVLMGTYQKQA